MGNFLDRALGAAQIQSYAVLLSYQLLNDQPRNFNQGSFRVQLPFQPRQQLQPLAHHPHLGRLQEQQPLAHLSLELLLRLNYLLTRQRVLQNLLTNHYCLCHCLLEHHRKPRSLIGQMLCRVVLGRLLLRQLPCGIVQSIFRSHLYRALDVVDLILNTTFTITVEYAQAATITFAYHVTGLVKGACTGLDLGMRRLLNGEQEGFWRFATKCGETPYAPRESLYTS